MAMKLRGWRSHLWRNCLSPFLEGRVCAGGVGGAGGLTLPPVACWGLSPDFTNTGSFLYLSFLTRKRQNAD